jgi:hypothetical protein
MDDCIPGKLMCSSGFLCRPLDERKPDQGGECIDSQSAVYWEDGSVKCGTGLSDCQAPFQCVSNPGIKCASRSVCPGQCALINQNGRRACLSQSTAGVTGKCPQGFHCRILNWQLRDLGGECVAGVCPEGEAAC